MLTLQSHTNEILCCLSTFLLFPTLPPSSVRAFRLHIDTVTATRNVSDKYYCWLQLTTWVSSLFFHNTLPITKYFGSQTRASFFHFHSFHFFLHFDFHCLSSTRSSQISLLSSSNLMVPGLSPPPPQAEASLHTCAGIFLECGSSFPKATFFIYDLTLIATISVINFFSHISLLTCVLHLFGVELIVFIGARMVLCFEFQMKTMQITEMF